MVGPPVLLLPSRFFSAALRRAPKFLANFPKSGLHRGAQVWYTSTRSPEFRSGVEGSVREFRWTIERRAAWPVGKVGSVAIWGLRERTFRDGRTISLFFYRVNEPRPDGVNAV